jgi:hypothetical protein
MENVNEELDQPFYDVVTNRIEKQDQKIVDLEKQLSNIPDNSQAISVVINGIKELKQIANKNTIPENDLRQLNINLNKTIGYLSQPVVNKVEHHHHIPKIVIVSAVLFAVICLIIAGWYNTYLHLEQYKENDTKYRFLKVQHNKPLHNLLFKTDSLYKLHSDMRDNVIRKEDSILDRFKRMQELEAKEKEVKDIKEKLK